MVPFRCGLLPAAGSGPGSGLAGLSLGAERGAPGYAARPPLNGRLLGVDRGGSAYDELLQSAAGSETLAAAPPPPQLLQTVASRSQGKPGTAPATQP